MRKKESEQERREDTLLLLGMIFGDTQRGRGRNTEGISGKKFD